jgi:putative redox protein
MESMKSMDATVEYVGNDFYIGISASGHAQVMDLNGARSAAANPVELVLLALGACTGGDVVSILQKKREKVTGYKVELRGFRREEYPRAFQRIEMRHIVRGRGVSEKSVARAIELSAEKYCSVAATLRPTAKIVSTYEIQEESAGP